jgi:tungstate transport system substrate-binding protein
MPPLFTGGIVMKTFRYFFCSLVITAAICGGPLFARGQKDAAPVTPKGTVVLFTTTSTQDSGLLDAILPVFTAETGWEVDVHSVGSGAALKAGTDGEADVLLVHSPADEEKYMAEGKGVKRSSVMFNTFYVVGPASPIAYNNDIIATLKQIAAQNLPFVSRADRSGTHTMELSLWKQAGVDETKLAKRTEAGAGMAATLKIADEMQGYTLSDSATWLKQKDNFKLTVVCDGSTPLLNYYSVIPVNPANSARVNAEAGKAFADWLLKPATQKLIADYKLNGQTMFTPYAGKW